MQEARNAWHRSESHRSSRALYPSARRTGGLEVPVQPLHLRTLARGCVVSLPSLLDARSLLSLPRFGGLTKADFANACIPLSTAKSAGLAQGATLHPLQQKEGKMPLQQVRAKVIYQRV